MVGAAYSARLPARVSNSNTEFGGGHFLEASSAGRAAVPDRIRTTSDMPDDVSGPQLHLVYAIPADGVDEGLDTNGVIEGTVQVWETWLAGQTGGRILRLDTYHGADDITFVRLPQTDAQIAATGVHVYDTVAADLQADGLIQPGKLYGVYYGGSSYALCGAARRGSGVGVLILHGAPPGAPPCDSNHFASPGQAPGYLDFLMLHELVHALGFVAPCAPHYAPHGHVSDSPNDLMYSGPLPWHPTTLDVGNDDYYNAHIPGCPDLSDSPYLEQTVKVSVVTFGTGTVTSNPAGISCPTTCDDLLPTPVTLTATPAQGEVFERWNGACSGTAPCTLTTAAIVIAAFASPSHGRSVSLHIRAHQVAGRLRVSDGYNACRSRVTVIVQRRRSHAWTTLRRTRTDPAGNFALSIPKGRARYRARAPQTSAGGQTCNPATSKIATTP